MRSSPMTAGWRIRSNSSPANLAASTMMAMSRRIGPAPALTRSQTEDRIQSLGWTVLTPCSLGATGSLASKREGHCGTRAQDADGEVVDAEQTVECEGHARREEETDSKPKS